MKINFYKKQAIIAILISVIATAMFAQTAPRVGEAAPAFSVVTADGKTLTNDSYKKQAVILHFWGTWCPPCRAELPHMNELAERIAKNPDSNISFLAVAVSDTPTAVNAYMEKNKYTFTGGLDTTNEVAAAYRIQAVPTSILIGADGKIEKIQIGAMTKAQLENFVSKYMK